MKTMEGKTVLITGGGKGGGIGYGISTAFAKEGANLVITGRNEKKMEDAKEELKRLYGIFVLTIQADGSQEDQVKRAVSRAGAEFGKIHVLINNAQNSASGVMLANHTKEDFDRAIYSGLYASFFYMKYSFLGRRIRSLSRFSKQTCPGCKVNHRTLCLL